MSARESIERMEGQARTTAISSACVSPPEIDAEHLAAEAAAAYADQLSRLRDSITDRELPPELAERPPDWDVQRRLRAPVEDVSFGDIEYLSRHDPAVAQARWEEVKAAARRQLESGFTAGRALEFLGGNAWERARFLAVRTQLRQAWPPRHGGEAHLLDEMAQYEMLRQTWLSVLAMLSRAQHGKGLAMLRAGKAEQPPRTLDAAHATAEAMRLVQHLQRLFQNALRSLLQMRRRPAPVIVQRLAQINVAAGPQMNVALPARPPRADAEPTSGAESESLAV